MNTGKAFFVVAKKPWEKAPYGRAQISLEYLLTYSWALVLVASIIGVVVLLFGNPTDTAVFNSSQPTEFPLVGGNIDSANNVSVVIKNASGGTMTVTQIALDGAYFQESAPGSVGISGKSLPANISPNEEFRFIGIKYTNGVGTITVTYKDKTEFSRELTITGKKGTQAASGGGTGSGPPCGNGAIDGSDVCDGAALAGKSCTDFGLLNGSLSCKSDCTGFVLSSCLTCGNGAIDGSDVCDGAALAGQTCLTQGFLGGTLACKADCLAFDKSGCGLAAYWKFDEGIGSAAADSSGSGNNGILYNGPVWVSSCPSVKCIQFDGVNDYVQVPDSSTIEPAQITASLWIKPTVWSGTANALIAKRQAGTNGYFIFRYASNRINVDLGGSGSRWDTLYVPPLQWTHLVYTYNGTNGRLYVNGALNNTTALGTPASVPSTAPLRIGADTSAAQYYFTGSMDEVKIYNRALSATEVCDDCKKYAANVAAIQPGFACSCP